ncbi:MAG: sensor histidine kinase [Chthonomonadales bacterium]
MSTNTLPSMPGGDLLTEESIISVFEEAEIIAGRRALYILNNASGIDAISGLVELVRDICCAKHATFGILRGDSHDIVRLIESGERYMFSDDAAIRTTSETMIQKCIGREHFFYEPKSASEVNGPESCAAILIRRDGRPQGILVFEQLPVIEDETNRLLEVVQSLSGFLSLAVHNLQMMSQQRRLVRAVMAAQEEERRRIAYDLHDGVAQYVLASHAHMQSFKYANESGNTTGASVELEHGLNCLKKAIVESRRLINGQRSLALDDIGLGGALQQLLNDEKGRSGWDEAILIDNTTVKDFDRVLATTVFRIAQEALTNIRKHANTTRVRVMLLESDDAQVGGKSIVLEVRDWGRGFRPENVTLSNDHVGLQSMQERVGLLGGNLAINSVDGEGTSVRAILPLSRFLTPEAEDDIK